MALRASWNVSEWSETGLAFGIKHPSTVGDIDHRDQREVYWLCRYPEAPSLRSRYKEVFFRRLSFPGGLEQNGVRAILRFNGRWVQG
jgi:hypothetical protein